MSEYTREEILKMIEENGGPEDLDLSGKDLSRIALTSEFIAQELDKVKALDPSRVPPWFSEETGGINLQGAILSGANLQGTFLSGANLQEASLVETNLQQAILFQTNLRRAGLDGANLQQAALFEANLQQASLDGADLQRASPWGSNFQQASLVGANLHEAVLWATNLQEAILDGATLQDVRLDGAKLQKARLFGTHVEKVDFSVAASLAGAYFYCARLDQTRMTKEQLGSAIGEEIDKEYYVAKEAYLLLKNNFNQIGRYDDASWAYVKERRMEKMTYHPKLARNYYAKIEDLPEAASPKSWAWWRFYVKYTLKWAWDWIIELSCGYGERPLNVVFVASLVLIIFPFLYSLTGLTPGNGQNLPPWDYLLYSLYAFASMEHPTLQATSRIAQFFTGLESLSGIALLALLMYTLGRRISRS